MRKQRLVIFAALEMEARAAAAAWGIPFARDTVLQHKTRLVEVHTIGMRAVRLPSALAALDLSNADSVWMVGLAGALDPALRVGDLVIDSDGSEPAPQFADRFIRRGRIYTSDRLIATPGEKRALFARTGALAVDMEQQIVREMLAPRGIPLVGIRAISDTADTSLDPALPGLVNCIGRPRWPALASALLRRPARLLSLIRLGKESFYAARQLTRAISRLAE